MFDRWRSSQEGKEQSDQEYHRAITSLYQQVQSVISDVNDIANNLSAAYPQEALYHLARHFEGISREFTNYTMARGNIFYEVVRRSNLRTKAVKKVAQQAKTAAKLFEKYSRKAKSYSEINSRLEINKVQVALDNLIAHCL